MRRLDRRRGATHGVTRHVLGRARLVECGSRAKPAMSSTTRIRRASRPRAATRISAEVHALGNPEGRGVLALEIRRPGTTFRAWDNVRFPLRAIDIDATLEALNLTRDASPRVHRRAEGGAPRRAAVRRLGVLSARASRADAAADHRRVRVAAAHAARARGPRQRRCGRGGERLGTLERGESALVPAHVGAYRLVADGEPAALVKVDLPPYAD